MSLWHVAKLFLCSVAVSWALMDSDAVIQL